MAKAGTTTTTDQTGAAGPAAVAPPAGSTASGTAPDARRLVSFIARSLTVARAAGCRAADLAGCEPFIIGLCDRYTAERHWPEAERRAFVETLLTAVLGPAGGTAKPAAAAPLPLPAGLADPRRLALLTAGQQAASALALDDPTAERLLTQTVQGLNSGTIAGNLINPPSHRLARAERSVTLAVFSPTGDWLRAALNGLNTPADYLRDGIAVSRFTEPPPALRLAMLLTDYADAAGAVHCIGLCGGDPARQGYLAVRLCEAAEPGHMLMTADLTPYCDDLALAHSPTPAPSWLPGAPLTLARLGRPLQAGG